jgi:hypothetical protein
MPSGSRPDSPSWHWPWRSRAWTVLTSPSEAMGGSQIKKSRREKRPLLGKLRNARPWVCIGTREGTRGSSERDDRRIIQQWKYWLGTRG